MGGPSGNYSESSSDVQRINTLTPEQEKIWAKLGPIITDNLGVGIEPYAGTLVPEDSEIQEETFARFMSLFGDGGTGEGGASRMEALNRMLSGDLPMDIRDIYEQSIAAPGRADFYGRFGAADQIAHRYGSRGPGGVTYANLADAAGEMEVGLAGKGAGLVSEIYQAQIGATPGLVASSLANERQPFDIGQDLGATQYGQQAGRDSAEFARWEMGQPWANPWLRYMPFAAGTQTITPVATTDSVSYGGGLS